MGWGGGVWTPFPQLCNCSPKIGPGSWVALRQAVLGWFQSLGQLVTSPCALQKARLGLSAAEEITPRFR